MIWNWIYEIDLHILVICELYNERNLVRYLSIEHESVAYVEVKGYCAPWMSYG